MHAISKRSIHRRRPKKSVSGCVSNSASMAMPLSGISRSVLTAAVAAVIGLGLAAPAHAKFDVPTGAGSSPLFGAAPFTQKMLMFEEFGPQPLPTSASAHSLPEPGGCEGPLNPSTYSADLDKFLSEPLYPPTQRLANTSSPNPWSARISDCIGRPMTGVLEGRPGGEDFAHQRWSDFPPTSDAGAVYFQTAMAGARKNGGLRDNLQSHGYTYGEFGTGGLYHNTTGLPGFDGTTAGIEIRFHPKMPIQNPQALWTFDGTLPPKLLMAPYGRTILFRHYNALPIDDSANYGFGKHTITTHEHNGHNPAESDGYAGAYFFPGEFYDYRWPMVLAGHDSVPINSSDPILQEKNSKAGSPACFDPRPGNCATWGGVKKVRGNWHETMSTHWFHDHMVDYTAQNVYKGNAAMMNYYSAIDRGNEGLNDGINLRLPSGTALDWGNRDYDINLVVADKAFDSQGQLWFNTFQTDGFLGDVATVNFLYKPYFDVRARRYRFRILNGSVSRYWKLALVQQVSGSGGKYPGPSGSGVSYNQVPFHLVANDGNILEHAVPFPNVQSPEGLPSQGIAERYDIVVDFSQVPVGSKLYFVNLLEHEDGKGPKQAIPLAQVLSGAYSKSGCPASCDPVVGSFMEFRVQAMQAGAQDVSMNPADYVEGKKTMIPLPGFSKQELANAKERTFTFNRGGDVKPWTISTDGGQSYNATSVEGLFDRVSAAPDGTGKDGSANSVEIWHIRNGGQGWSHPVHIHFEEGQILERGGVAPPLWEKGARKDMYRIGPMADTTDSVDIAIRVREFQGTYVEHCHNTQHEDNAMLLRWDSQHPGQTVAIQSPFPSWDGVNYMNTNTTDVPTYKSGQQTTFLGSVAGPVAANDTAAATAGVPAIIQVLDNDSCVGNCDPATLVIGSVSGNGKAINNGNGTVSYLGTDNGTYSFTYTVKDTTTGSKVSNVATVTVNVTGGVTPPPPLAAPVTVADSATTQQDTVIGINVVANDSNCGSGCSLSIASAPAHGKVTANSPAAGQITYTPTAGYSGADSFTYTATNSGGTSAPATVSLTVNANPTTDKVTISKAAISKKTLSVAGSLSKLNNAYAPSVMVYSGGMNASATACAGSILGSSAVTSAGAWSLSAKNVTPTSVCVWSANGGVASAAVK